jgi:hypothetical protein
MKSWKCNLVWLVVSGLLLGAVALQLFGPAQNTLPAAAVIGRLAKALPVELISWRVIDEPLGQNELVKAGVEDVLRFDDYVFRRYSQGALWFSVYVAYWQPGKMPTRLVAEHTPDRCWVENGWICDFKEHRRTLAVNERQLWPAEYRAFRATGLGGEPHHVLFWLLVDGKPYNFSQHGNLVRHAVRWWSGAVTEFARQRPPEQYFIRITANSPIDTIWAEPGFKDVMESVAKLGLFR